MSKTEPATKGDLVTVTVIIIVCLVFALYVSEYRITRTIDAVDRIEQKVNQPCR